MAQGLRANIHVPQHVTDVEPSDAAALFRPPEPSQFALGLRAGTRGLLSAVGRAGEAAGLDTAEFAEEQEELAREAASGKRVESVQDISSPAEFVDWAAFGLGEIAPSVVASLAGGGTGGLLARAVIGGTRATAGGAAAGAFGASAVPQAGSIFQEIREESGIEAPGEAFAGGAVAGALDILPQARLLRRFIEPAARTGLGREVLTQTGMEAATEAGQESIALGVRAAVDPEFDPLADENRRETINRLIEAGALGALGGSVGGALSFGASRVVPSADRTGQPGVVPPPGGATSESRSFQDELERAVEEAEFRRDEALDQGELDEIEGRLEALDVAARAQGGPGTYAMINSTEFFKGAALTPEARQRLGLKKIKPKRDSLVNKLNEMNAQWFRDNPDQVVDRDVMPYRITTTLEQAEEEAMRAFPYDANLRRRYIDDFAQGILDDKEGVTVQRRYADALADRERAAARGDQEGVAAAEQAIEEAGARLERIQPVDYRPLGDRDGQFDSRQFLRQFHTIAGATTQRPDVDLKLTNLPKQRSGPGFEANVSWKAQPGQELKEGEFVSQTEGRSERIVNLQNVLSVIRKQGFKPAQRADERDPTIHEKLADEISTAMILLNDRGWVPDFQTLDQLVTMVGPDTVVRRGTKNQKPITMMDVVNRGLFTNPRVFQGKDFIGLEKLFTKPEHLTNEQWEQQKAFHARVVSGMEARAFRYAEQEIEAGSEKDFDALMDEFWDQNGGRIAFDPRDIETFQGEGLESLPEQIEEATPPETDPTGMFIGEPPGLTRQETFRPSQRDTRIVADELESRLESARTLAHLVALEDQYLGPTASRLQGPLGPPGREEAPGVPPRPVREQIRTLNASVKRLRRARPRQEIFDRVPGYEEIYNDLVRGEELKLEQAEWEARIGKQVRARLQAEVKRLRDPKRGPLTERAEIEEQASQEEEQEAVDLRAGREALRAIPEVEATQAAQERRERKQLGSVRGLLDAYLADRGVTLVDGVPRETTKYQASETIQLEELRAQDEAIAQSGEWSDNPELRQETAERVVRQSREDKEDAIRLNRQAVPLTPEMMPLFERLGDRGVTDAAQMIETLGLNPNQVEYVTPERTAWFLNFLTEDMGRPELTRSIERGSTHGLSILTRSRSTGEPRVFVWARGDLDTDLFSRILAHEMGHAMEYLRATEIPANVRKALLDEYTQWRQKFQDPNTQVLDILRSRKGDEAALLALLGTGRISNFDVNLELGELSDASQEYALSFNEWWADRVSEWMHRPASEARTAVERFFAAIADALRKLFRQYPVDRTIDDYLASLHGTARRWSHPTSAVDMGRVANPGQRLPHEYRRGIARLSRGILDDDPDDIAQAAWLDSNRTLDGEMWSAWVGDVWPALSPDMRSSIGRLSLSAPIQSQLRRLLANDPRALEGIREPKVASAYAYQFWRAGQLNINQEMEENLNPIRNAFLNIVRFIANEDGELGNPTDVEDSLRAFDALRDTRMRVDGMDPRFTSRRAVTEGTMDVVRNWAQAFDRFSRIGSSLFSTLDSQLRSTGNPALMQLANSFYKVTGRISTESGFWQARNMRIGEFTNQAKKIFDVVPAEDMARFMDYVYSAQPLDQAPRDWRDGVRELRALMRNMLDYQKEAGVSTRDLGEDYFPWVLDLEQLENNREPFFGVINQPKYFEGRVDVAIGVNKRQLRAQANRADERLTSAEINSIAEDYARNASPLIPSWADPSELIDETQVADYIYNGALNSQGYADVEVDLENQAPTMRFMNTRLLNFVEPQEIRRFLSNDAPQSILSYIYQAVKHAEYSRRFGEDGSKLDQLMQEAREFGATPDDIELADNAVKANLGTYGRERAQWLHDKLGFALPEPGAPINDTLQRSMGAMLVFQNMKYLGLATITSLVDPIGIGVRGNSLSMSLRSMMTAVRESVRREPTELTDLASMLGLIEQGGTNEAISWRFEGEYMKGMARNINDKWFKIIGLDAWTRMTRLAATSAAQSFLRKHTQKPNRHSARYLEELNLFPGDVQFQENGMVRILTPAERREASLEELARDNRVRSAIAQFVDESILRPNPMQRTLWGSDPHFILFQHLKSFMYSFYTVILKRAATELGNHNFYSLMTLGMFIPAMMAATALRDLIKYGEDGNPYKSNWSTWDYMTDAALRSGLYGYMGTIGEDVSSDIDYGGYGIGGMFSTLAGTLEDIDNVLALEGDALIRQLPGNTIYNNWVQ